MHTRPVALLLAATIAGQDAGSEQNAKTWRSEAWHTRLDAARASAAERAALILAYTPCSTPCADGDSFETRVLAHPDFTRVAADLVLLLQAPTRAEPSVGPAARAQTPAPAQVALLDATGTLQARLDPATCTLDTLTRAIEATHGSIDLAATLRALPADEAAAHAGELLVAEAELGKYDFVELDKRMQALGDKLSPEQRARIRPVHVELECVWLSQQIDMSDNERRARLLRLLREKRLPTGRVRTRFWTMYGDCGVATGDLAMIETALEALPGGGEVSDDVRARLQTHADELRRRR